MNDNETVNTLNAAQSINRLSFEQRSVLSMAYRNRSALMKDAKDKGINSYNVYLLNKVDVEAFNAVSKSLALIRYNLRGLRFGSHDDGNYADVILAENHEDCINGIEVLDLIMNCGLIETPFKDMFSGLIVLPGTLQRYFSDINYKITEIKNILKEKKIEHNTKANAPSNPTISYINGEPYWEFCFFKFDNKDEQLSCVNHLINNGFNVTYSIPEYGKDDLDLTINEVMADVYGLRPYLITNRKRLTGGGQFFNRKEIGEEKYNSVMASASRLLKRLEQRGLCYRVKRKSKLWIETGIKLTDNGFNLSKELKNMYNSAA